MMTQHDHDGGVTVSFSSLGKWTAGLVAVVAAAALIGLGTQVSEAQNKQEVSEAIDSRIEPLKVTLRSIDARLARIETKLDREP